VIPLRAVSDARFRPPVPSGFAKREIHHHINTRENYMNKSELIDKVAAVAELNKASAARAVEAMLDGIAEALKGGAQVTLSGFGTFSVTQRAERTGRNPRTGETLTIPASKNPKFKAGKGLKDAVN